MARAPALRSASAGTVYFPYRRYLIFLWYIQAAIGGLNGRRAMLVGVPKEIKDNEYRVGLVPSTVRELTLKGHRVLIETNAGLGAGLTDEDYAAAGAETAPTAERVFAEAELIVKVKEPLAAERR